MLSAAAGMPPARVARHALRRVLAPLLPQVGFVAVGLAGGAVAVETVFAVPGLGGTARDAALGRDLPVLQACVLLLLLLGFLVGGLVGVARRALLGPALDAGALPGLRRPRVAAGRGRAWAAAGVAAVLVVLVVVGLCRDPLQVNTAVRLAAPDLAHPLGTDSLGRDVLARLGHGAARTCLTAVAVAARLGLGVEVDDGLRETHFGAWEGLTFKEVGARYPGDLKAWLGSSDAAPTGGGESFAEVADRVAKARDRLTAAHRGRTALLVSHVTPIKTLVRLALGAPSEAMFRMELAAASLTTVAYYADGNASVRCLNETAHLS